MIVNTIADDLHASSTSAEHCVHQHVQHLAHMESAQNLQHLQQPACLQQTYVLFYTAWSENIALKASAHTHIRQAALCHNCVFCMPETSSAFTSRAS